MIPRFCETGAPGRCVVPEHLADTIRVSGRLVVFKEEQYLDSELKCHYHLNIAYEYRKGEINV